MIEIELAPQIQETLAIEAGRRGLSLQELIRAILGTYAAGEMQGGALRAPIYPSSGQFSGISPGPPITPPGESLKLAAQMMRMGAAMMGQLSCNNCTQRLSMTDVEKGSCSKCEAPVE